MKKILFFLIFSLSIGYNAKGQAQIDTVGYLVRGLLIDGDTVPHICLRTVTILPPLQFKNQREAKQYTRLVRYVKKVYPYSQIIKKKLIEIDNELAKLDNDRQRKKYIKKAEKELREEFEGELRELTFSQGRILIKLVDRETGETSYELVKELKGSVSAFFWQSVAVLFQSSLKYEYDADGTDWMIEDIVIRIENGTL